MVPSTTSGRRSGPAAGATGTEPIAGSRSEQHTFEQLDYIYWPSRDVAADVAYLVDSAGATLGFAIEGMGTRVAMVDLGAGSPSILLADHLEGEAPILVYRVDDYAESLRELGEHGWTPTRTLEIPFGPCASFETPGGQRIAVYQRTRPQLEDVFRRRRDF